MNQQNPVMYHNPIPCWKLYLAKLILANEERFVSNIKLVQGGKMLRNLSCTAQVIAKIHYQAFYHTLSFKLGGY